MNELQNKINNGPVTMNAEPERKVLDLLNFQGELRLITESEFKNLYEAISRLDLIANRLDSTRYPKNTPKEVALKPDPDGRPIDNIATGSDGLVGTVIHHNERNSNLVYELSNKIVPAIFEAITYIEQHI